MFPCSASDDRIVNFQWSLYPIFVLNRILGIEVFQISNRLKRCLSLLFGSLMLLITFKTRVGQMSQVMDHIAVVRATMQERASNASCDVNSVTITQTVNQIFLNIQAILAGIGIHLTMFVVALFHWKRLENCIKKMERVNAYGNAFYCKIRKVSIIGVVGVTAVSNTVMNSIIIYLNYVFHDLCILII